MGDTDQKFALHTYPPLAWRFAFCCAQLWCIQQGRGAEDRTLTWATRCKQAIARTCQGPGGGDSDICAVSECFKLDIKRSHAHPLWYRLGTLFKTKNSRIPGMFVSHVPESCFTLSLKSVHLDCRRSIWFVKTELFFRSLMSSVNSWIYNKFNQNHQTHVSRVSTTVKFLSSQLLFAKKLLASLGDNQTPKKKNLQYPYFWYFWWNTLTQGSHGVNSSTCSRLHRGEVETP